MFSHLVYTFPQLALLVGVLHLSINRLLREDTSKFFARIARFWLLVSFLGGIILYDKSFNLKYFNNNAYTLLFNFGITIFIYEILGVVPQWFNAQKKIGCRYYVYILLAITILNLMVASVNLLTTISCYTLLVFINYRLLSINYENKTPEIAGRYLTISGIMLLIFASSLYLLYYQYGCVWDYAHLKELYAKDTSSLSLYLTLSAIIIPFLYALNIAPFHVVTEEVTSKSILPVSQYLTLISPIAYWGAFMKINISIATPFASDLSVVYAFFAILSIVFGAVGVNSRINLHRIYAFGTMYQFGVALLLLSFFKQQTNFTAALYLLTYFLSINGVYLVFYSLKSRNEYLSSLTSLSGLSQTRPYATAMLLISLFSLIGLPPLAGFIGQVSMVAEFTSEKAYIYLAVIFFFLLLLAKAYWEIIKTAYFDSKIINYDTENNSLWLYMIISILCIVTITFNPFGIIEIIKDMFYVIYL